MPDALETPVPLTVKLVNLRIQAANQFHGLFNGRPELAPLALPSIDVVHLLCSASHLSVDLFTHPALLRHSISGHDQLHATCFTNSIFPVAMLTEVAPLPVAAHKPMLIKEAHGDGLAILA